ncbi:MAG: SDR family NAD(P)-dependent oxidoreductase [Anaerolineae bacterium]|nr:SDR family NAD(P)-dependent oxidoreductase [Anaerolineae bacterium]
MTPIQDLQHLTAVVTGATSGIGQATAAALAARGAWVIGVGRSEARCRAAREAVLTASPQARISFLTADLASQREVRQLAADIRSTLRAEDTERLDVLINSAGTVSSWRDVTEDGYELQFAVNHLAPFLLTLELMPLLEAAPSPRVITVSSGSHYRTRMRWEDVMYRQGYQVLKSYKQSKLANVLFTAEFNRRYLEARGVRAYAADPGLVNTQIGLKGTHGLARWVWQRRSARGAGPEEAAEGIVFLATDPAAGEDEGVYWKDCRPKQPSAQARDGAEAARLWALSARLCGLSGA